MLIIRKKLYGEGEHQRVLNRRSDLQVRDGQRPTVKKNSSKEKRRENLQLIYIMAYSIHPAKKTSVYLVFPQNDVNHTNNFRKQTSILTRCKMDQI